jgi:hypothetical protein
LCAIAGIGENSSSTSRLRGAAGRTWRNTIGA